MSTECDMGDANDKATHIDPSNPEDPSESLITLVVGPNQERFTVPEALLRAKVSFFQDAFEGNFSEAQTKTFTFPDDEAENFRSLLEWVKDGPDVRVATNAPWFSLSKLWIFGDKYHVDELQNKIINTLSMQFAAYRSGINISYETLDYVVENTYQRSPLRRIFVDMLVNGISLQQLPSRVANIPSELLQDMVVALKESVYLNSPTATSLLSNPVESYYVSSAHTKANAMPTRRSSSERATPFYCAGHSCARQGRPIIDAMYICIYHQLKLCEGCASDHCNHQLKLISLTSSAYQNTAVTGNMTIIDGQVNDSGFYCDGPACDPDQDQRTHRVHGLMSGERYHCLDCRNVDFCTLCVRGELRCKEAGHSILRIRPTFAKRNKLREVSIPVRQKRASEGVCWRCGVEGHETESCEEVMKGGEEDVEIED